MHQSSAPSIVGMLFGSPFWWGCQAPPAISSGCPHCCQNNTLSASPSVLGTQRNHHIQWIGRWWPCLFLAKNFWELSALWVGALSWWSSQFFFFVLTTGWGVYSSHFHATAAKHHTRNWNSQSGQQGQIHYAWFPWRRRKRLPHALDVAFWLSVLVTLDFSIGMTATLHLVITINSAVITSYDLW